MERAKQCGSLKAYSKNKKSLSLFELSDFLVIYGIIFTNLVKKAS